MDYRTLGRTDIKVSLICLGTMTWGSQNSEAEAHAQLDLAFDEGVNFIDTAEGYPVTPVSADTQFLTETYIGNWIAGRKKRDDIILATKVSGPVRDPIRTFRGGNNRLDRRNIELAIDDSLKRLQTDYIDLYQVHWPDRPVASFGVRGLSQLADTPDTIPIEETLDALGDLVKAGKVRQIGVSNESLGAYRNISASRATRGCPGSRRSRTPITCSTERSNMDCLNSPCANRSDC
jgi:aryl-alcohol dehydrogenase-like predicted oxidoreductase